jgi:hypothetical protein
MVLPANLWFALSYKVYELVNSRGSQMKNTLFIGLLFFLVLETSFVVIPATTGGFNDDYATTWWESIAMQLFAVGAQAEPNDSGKDVLEKEYLSSAIDTSLFSDIRFYPTALFSSLQVNLLLYPVIAIQVPPPKIA